MSTLDRVDLRTVRHRTKKRVHTAFTKPGGLFGKPVQPSPCPYSWWLDAEFFYALAKVRAEETKGRTKDLSRVDSL